MKIAVNTRWLLPNKMEGFGWYTFHVLTHLTKLLPNAEFYFINDRGIKNKMIERLNVRYITVPPPARHPFLWYLWNEYSVPFILKRINADIYFSPDGFLPSKLKIPTLTTIHDLNFEEENDFVDKRAKEYYKKHIRKAATVASHILTVSEFSKNDIIKHYTIGESKITATHNGPQSEFKDCSHKRISTLQRYAKSKPFFLFVGAQNPRKNLANIFKAFDGFIEKTKSNFQLLLVGERMHWNEDICTAWENMKHKDHVLFTGRISSTDLNNIYSAATGLLYPSIFEGFGIPIIEAFAAGCPVITSLSTAMPEVAGDAAILVDPTSIDEIILAMEKLALDDAAGEIMRTKGFERAKLFKWEKVAEDVAKNIKKLTVA